MKRPRNCLPVALVVLLLSGCRTETPQPETEPADAALFREAAADSGLHFHHFNGATGAFYFPEIMVSGLALLDYDRDGDLDVYLVQGQVVGPDSDPAAALLPPPASQPPGNRLFRNNLVETGSLRFTDVTDRAGVGDDGVGIGVAAGDADNDGYPDLYVTNYGGNIFYRNKGDGTFVDETAASGTDDPRYSAGASFVDYDHDGDLDLYVVNYVDFSARVNRRCTNSRGSRDYCGPQVFPPVSDKLFRNDGKARFTDVSGAAGMTAIEAPGLGLTAADFNEDGLLDIYVANDRRANQLWVNDGAGTLEDAGWMSGSAHNADGAEEAGMGVAAQDFDGDGDEDVLITNMFMESNTLYVNDGAGNFFDETLERGLGDTSMSYTGFGCGWLDYDNDGDLDLFVANGAVLAEMRLLGTHVFPYQQTNQLFRNDGGRFTDVSRAAGPPFALAEVSRGAAFGDVDNDGDIDIVVSNSGGPARLLLNDTDPENHWLRVRLNGVESNRDGTGARVGLLRENRVVSWRRARRDGSYLSASDIRVHFGLGADASVPGLVVHWPSGRREVWREVIAAGTEVTLREGDGEPAG